MAIRTISPKEVLRQEQDNNTGGSSNSSSTHSVVDYSDEHTYQYDSYEPEEPDSEEVEDTEEGVNDLTYEEWVESMKARGIDDFTSIGVTEANFQDYAAALSDDLKQEIIDSVTTKEDKELQAMIAAFFVEGDSNYLHSGAFQSYCKANGISCTIEWTDTSYIQDNKAHGNTKTDAINGHIAVYTLTDANGGEIKIADSNGNGAIEIEEVFMNEILSSVTTDIMADDIEIVAAHHHGHGYGDASGAGIMSENTDGTDSATDLGEETAEESTTQDNRQVISEAEFISLVRNSMLDSGTSDVAAKNAILEKYSVEGFDNNAAIRIAIDTSDIFN